MCVCIYIYICIPCGPQGLFVLHPRVKQTCPSKTNMSNVIDFDMHLFDTCGLPKRSLGRLSWVVRRHQRADPVNQGP